MILILSINEVWVTYLVIFGWSSGLFVLVYLGVLSTFPLSPRKLKWSSVVVLALWTKTCLFFYEIIKKKKIFFCYFNFCIFFLEGIFTILFWFLCRVFTCCLGKSKILLVPRKKRFIAFIVVYTNIALKTTF